VRGEDQPSIKQSREEYYYEDENQHELTVDVEAESKKAYAVGQDGGMEGPRVR
jgi:hypothetical protein